MSVRPYSRVRLSVCALSLVLLALSWGYFSLTFVRERQALQSQAEKHVQSVALGFEEHTRRIIQAQDMLLLDMAEHLRDGIQPLELQGVISQWLENSEQLGGLLIVDPAIRQVYVKVSRRPLPDRLPGLIPESFSNAVSPLRISDRVYVDPAGEEHLSLSRQVPADSKHFLVIALLRSRYLLDIYQSADLGESGTLSILHEKGNLLACQPANKTLIGSSFAQGALFKEYLPRKPVGLSHVSTISDNIKRIVAYRKIANLPLVITVGAAVDSIFAGWQASLIKFILIQLTISFAIILSMLLLLRALTRMEEAELRLREREEHFRAVANSSVDGVMSIDQNGRVRFWSQGSEKIFGYAEDAARGMPLLTLLDFDRPDPVLDILSEQALEGFQHSMGGTIEARGIRSNGWLFPVELSVSIGTVNEETVYTLIVRDVTERRLLEEQIRRMASHDVLTRLPNRALLMDRLEVAIAQVRREGGCFALLFLDLDEFKPVNDQYGHEVGDRLLQQAAGRLHDAFRASDTVARVGGDEFAALLHNVQSEAAVKKTCHTIIASLGEEFVVGEIRANIGCSIGAALYRGEDLSGADLMRMADAAMYQAKHAGKNSCRLVSCDEE